MYNGIWYRIGSGTHIWIFILTIVAIIVVSWNRSDRCTARERRPALHPSPRTQQSMISLSGAMGVRLMHSDPEDEPGEPIELPSAANLMRRVSQLISTGGQMSYMPSSAFENSRPRGLLPTCTTLPATCPMVLPGQYTMRRAQKQMRRPNAQHDETECPANCPFCGAATSTAKAPVRAADELAARSSSDDATAPPTSTHSPLATNAATAAEKPPAGRQRRKRVKKTIRLTNRIGLWSAPATL